MIKKILILITLIVDQYQDSNGTNYITNNYYNSEDGYYSHN